MSLATFNLLGKAQLWFGQMEQERIRIGLEPFQGMLSCEEYQRQFQSLQAKMINRKYHQQEDLFTTGLMEELRVGIEMQQPKNLGVAMNIARPLEGVPQSSTIENCRQQQFHGPN